MVWIWQHDKRTDDNKIVFNCVRKLMKNNEKKEDGKDPNFFKAVVQMFARVFANVNEP
jgi:hypothetical protein